MAHLVIGTRSNPLAVQQANWIKQRLEQRHVGLLVGLEILPDTDANEAAWQPEAELALRTRRVDALVHHLSELPARLADDFHLAAIVERIEARDALIVSAALRDQVTTLAALPLGARVIAEGWQRRVQIAEQQPQVRFVEGYGTLAVALRKLEAGEFDALVTDAFSLILIGAQERVTAWLATDEFLPAPGQGALALQSRLEDQRTNLLLEAINHAATRFATNAERATLRNLYGEPGDPIAVAATCPNNGSAQLTVRGLVGDAALPTPAKIIRGVTSGEPQAAELLGSALAVQLLDAGARGLLHRAQTQLAINGQAIEIESLYPAAFDQPSNEVPSHNAMPAAAVSNSINTFNRLKALPATSAVPMRKAVIQAFSEETANEFDLVATKVRKLRDQQPLHDQRVLLARAGGKQDDLIQQLEAVGAAVVTCPTVRAAEPSSWETLDKVLVHLSWYDWLCFASSYGVELCLKRLDALGYNRQELAARRLCAIGKTTVQCLAAAGFQTDLVLPHFTANDFAAEQEKLFGKRADLHGKTMLLFAAQPFAHEFTQTSRHPIRVGFDQLGVYVEAVATYRIALPTTIESETLKALHDAAFDYVVFHQAASVENLAAFCEPRTLLEFLATSRLVSLNESAREAAHAQGLTVHLRATDANARTVVKLLRYDCLQKQR